MATKSPAFVNGELRGADRVIYVPELDRYYIFLTVFADRDNEEVTFKWYDRGKRRGSVAV